MNGMEKDESQDRVAIYSSEDGRVHLDVKLDKETVWLSQSQLVYLFSSSKNNVSEHIKHIYSSGELEMQSTVRKIRTVQTEGSRRVSRNITFYNLDLIISLGYRINTKRGIEFRRWATSVLKDFLIKGYAINSRMGEENYRQMAQIVRSMSRTIKSGVLNQDERDALLDVVVDYTFALDRLDDYDHQRLAMPDSDNEELFRATYEGARGVVDSLKSKFGGSPLFGNEKDGSFRGCIGQIYQTFGGADLYPSIEEKAAMLLYLVVKNHCFSDGNKRIAAALFLWFMNENRLLYDEQGAKRVPDATLVALTLLVAESRTEEKDPIIKVIVNLI